MDYLRHKSRYLKKLVAMAGGFLILVGMILLGIAALALSGYLNVGMMLENKYLLTFAVVMTAVGLLDIFAAVIIARW
jgi:hypothetical protein